MEVVTKKEFCGKTIPHPEHDWNQGLKHCDGIAMTYDTLSLPYKLCSNHQSGIGHGLVGWTGHVWNNGEDSYICEPMKKSDDPVNHPSHYTAYEGLEIIDLTEQMNFNRGNAVKYIARAGLKSLDTDIQDLEKAVWYIQREIKRIKNARS